MLPHWIIGNVLHSAHIAEHDRGVSGARVHFVDGAIVVADEHNHITLRTCRDNKYTFYTT